MSPGRLRHQKWRELQGENSYGGVNRKQGSYVLSQEEMKILDGLDVSYRAGKLGRRDGWEDSDVTGPDWDPTEIV